jgi:hypothetical protein
MQHTLECADNCLSLRQLPFIRLDNFADLSFALGFCRPSITTTLENFAPAAIDPQNPR